MIYRPSQETGLSDPVGQGGGGDVLPDRMEGEGHHHITTPPTPSNFQTFLQSWEILFRRMLVNKWGQKQYNDSKYKKQQKIYLNLRIATDDYIQPKAVRWPSLSSFQTIS